MPMSHRNRNRRAKMRYRVQMNRERGATTPELGRISGYGPASCYRQLNDMETFEGGLVSRLELRDGRKVRVWYDPDHIPVLPGEAAVVALTSAGDRLPAARFFAYEPAIAYVRKQCRANHARIGGYEIFEAADGVPWPGRNVRGLQR